MTATNTLYLQSAINGALADFEQAAGPGNVNDPLFALACRLLELAHAAPGAYSEADAERDACERARQLGHDEQSIRDTWKSALRHTAGRAAVIPQPTYVNGAGASPAGYPDLAGYAQAHGVDVSVFAQAGWSDSELFQFSYQDPRTGKTETGYTDQERLTYDRRRRALLLTTDAGPRWRLIDEDRPKPKYWQRPGTHTDASKVWYRLTPALTLAAQHTVLILTNGEPSVVVGQHWGVPALCETGGGEKAIPPQLLQTLLTVWPPGQPILIALDCDKRGLLGAQRKRQQLRDAGYPDVRAVDLGLGPGQDLADACRLHQAGTLAYLQACADVPEPAGPTSQSRPAGAGAPAIPGANPAGQPRRTQSQANMAQLAALGYTFRLNRCGNLIEVNGDPIDDYKAAEIRTALRDTGITRFGAYEDAWVTHAAAHNYHPVQDYLSGLAWDGQDRIGQLTACFQGQNPTVTYQDGQTCPLTSVYLHRWLIGAVAKAFDAHQNAMLVFTGPQGLGKSRFARWLCPLALQERHFLEADINTRDKDAYVRLMQNFLWEVGELDRTTRKQDAAELKQFISERTVTVRRSYGRYDTRGPALASLIGTVNGTEFLADETGNRRFYVIDVQRLDWAYQQLDIDQIWAEAVARYRRGEPWRLLPEEDQLQTEHNRGFMADGIMGDYIRKYFFITHDPTHLMSNADILDTLRLKDVRLAGTDQGLANAIGRAMTALGVRRERSASARYYVGVCPR